MYSVPRKFFPSFCAMTLGSPDRFPLLIFSAIFSSASNELRRSFFRTTLSDGNGQVLDPQRWPSGP